MDDKLIDQHKRMAMGQDITADDNEKFGVSPHNHKHRPNTEPAGGRKRALHDRARAIPKAGGYHPEPDHGPFE